MDNLKIKITDDMEKYNSSKKADARVLGELNLGVRRYVWNLPGLLSA